MRKLRYHLVSTVACTLLAAATAYAQPPAKKALDHGDYDIWNRIAGQALSNDGTWALYGVVSEAGDPRVHVQPLRGGTAREIERAEGAQFSHDGRFVVFRIKPAKATVKQLREARTPAAQLPQDSIGILDVQSGTIVRAERLRTFKLPAKAGGWVAYTIAAPGDTSAAPQTGRGGGRGGAPPQAAQGGRGGQAAAGTQRRKEEGLPLVVRNLASGQERRIEDVTQYEFSPDGARLAWIVSTREGATDGVFVQELATGQSTARTAGHRRARSSHRVTLRCRRAGG
jgi:hypothetical protein